MRRKPAPQSRKEPRQARSQVTVTAILEATIRILEREGMDAATTTRIAEVAGVSVGTLYQYFAHRDAIPGRSSTFVVHAHFYEWGGQSLF